MTPGSVDDGNPVPAATAGWSHSRWWLCLVALLLSGPALAEPAREWPAWITLVSGQNTFCGNGGPVLIVEEDAKLTSMTRNRKFVGWSVPMAGDGSVSADIKSAYVNRMVRVKVPAGKAPRSFETVDLVHACRFRGDPDSGGK